MTKNYSPADELLNGLDSTTNEPAEQPGKEESHGDGENTKAEPSGE